MEAIAQHPYLAALGALGNGVCLLDAKGRVVYWNDRLQRLGLPYSAVADRPLAEVLPGLTDKPELLSRLTGLREGAIESREPKVMRDVELAFPAHDPQVFHLCFTPWEADSSHCLLIFQDATEARRIREQYENILDSTPDGVFVIDSDRRIRLFNQACARITGRTAEEILHRGCECSDVIHCHTEHGESYAHGLCPARDVFRGEVPHQREEMLLTNDAGEERWVETTYSAITNSEGKVDYVIGVLRDVHDRKVLEERLHQTEKLASLGQLVAGIAHEIKNPLAIILSSLNVMENKDRPEEQRLEAGRFIREEITRIDERLRAFLAFARPRDLHPRPLVLSGLLQRRAAALENLFPEIRFRIECEQPEPIVMGDEEQLSQVLTNLVLNASEVLEDKGVITLRARQNGSSALLEVEDDGPGIPREHLSRIFDPFFTTKAEGTGLGLSICYQIVLAHRGTISVLPGSGGKGTCFSIRLPVSARPESKAEG